jgi:hypothetical protein
MKHGRFAMRQFTVSLAVVVVLLVGVFASMGRSTTAQDANTAEHPIVGAWIWDNDPANPGTDISYAIFHDDGTYVEMTGGGPIVGAWEVTGERSVLLTGFGRVDLDEDPTTDGPVGTLTLRLEAEVDASGDMTTAPFTFEIKDTNGNVVFGGNAEARGTRIAVEPMVPVGTPMAGTPTA